MIIRIKSPGRYAIRLEVDGVTSPILLFRARSKAARLKVVTEPKTRLDGIASNVGDLFDISPGNLTSARRVNTGAPRSIALNIFIKAAKTLMVLMALILIFSSITFMPCINLSTFAHSVAGVR